MRPLRAVLATLAVGVAAGAAPATSVTLSSALGPLTWGVGGISGGGATSRLLFSYPEQQRDEILDYLFLPNFGASLHVLKVEIGGGAQSTEGTEASHMYTPDDLDCSRGYEWSLMVEAKKRNPSIRLGALPWTWPGWIDAASAPGHKSPWNNITASTGYVLAWLQCARDSYNLTIDYMGGWNERGHSMAYFSLLRQRMDAAGFTSTQLVCGDFPRSFECSEEIAANHSLAQLFLALGAHQPQAYDPVGASTGLPMWSTEAHYNIPDGSDWTFLQNQLYIQKNVTGYQSWALLSAYDDTLAFPDHGLFRAWWPTSGYYEVIGRMWATAHVTQFTQPNGQWHYLANGTGAGYLEFGGTYVGFRNAVTGDWSLVIEKQAGDPSAGGAPNGPETVTFNLDATLGGRTLQVWRSFANASANASDTSGYFLQQAPISASGSFTLDLQVGDIVTVTTLTTGNKGSFPSPPPQPVPFPTSYNDSFADCTIGQEANFFTSQDGSFLCVPSLDGSGTTVMRQMAQQWPIQWRPDEQRPHTLGGSALWADTNASIRFRLNAANDSALLGVRCFVDVSLPNALQISSEMWAVGAWVRIDAAASASSASQWALYPSYANATSRSNVVAQGSVDGAVMPGQWHSLSLSVEGGKAAASLDGAQLFSGVDASFAPATGYVGLGSADYGQLVEFADLAVQASY